MDSPGDVPAARPASLDRASLAEIFIPYGEPQPPRHCRKNVFDMGEYGIGVLANSLELGCDCLGEIRYFDAWLNDNDGHAQVLVDAVCLHEEDHGSAGSTWTGGPGKPRSGAPGDWSSR